MFYLIALSWLICASQQQQQTTVVYSDKISGHTIFIIIDSDGNLAPYLPKLDMLIEFYRSPYVTKRIKWPAGVLFLIRPNSPLYEYRSGLLIPMILDAQYRLVPEAGGKIITYQDYLAGDRSRNIYNLPQHLR